MRTSDLISQLQEQSGLLSKRDIRSAAQVFDHQPFPELGLMARLGDDTAVIPRQAGQLLFACEGMQPSLVESDPWFAGWSGVLVNLSDIAAMGGRPLAVVNSVWTSGPETLAALLEGLKFACDRFAVPMVGGHSNQHSPYQALSVAVLGAADGPVLSARNADAGDELWLLINQKGSFYRDYPFWDAATSAPPVQLRRHLSLLPELAAAGIVRAAKDISMGGITGTAVMFAEACGHSLRLELDCINPPSGVELVRWLTCFPSFGYLLAVHPSQKDALEYHLTHHSDLTCCRVGHFSSGKANVRLLVQGVTELLWHGEEALTGFGCVDCDSMQ